MHRRLLFILSIFSVTFLHAQIEENFDLENISELTNWSGALEAFIINDDKQLQLNAIEAGTSVIQTQASFLDVSQWNFLFNMEFAPSNSNRLRVYLYSDNEELENGNAYYLEIGESGSEDNLEFYRQDEGEEVLLGEGSMGALGDNPAKAKIKVIRDSTGFWSISAAYGEQPFVQPEFELLDNSHELAQGYFGMYCTYTATRSDKFFFDDVYVGPIVIDTDPPKLVRANFVDAKHVSLIFDEVLSENSALDINNYEFDNELGRPSKVSFGRYQNEVILELNQTAATGITYNLTISNIEDQLENVLNTSIELVILSVPLIGDLVINEILFNPYPDGEDFIELYNNSDKYLDLFSLRILNLDNEKSIVLNEDIRIAPHQYLAITPDREALFDSYMIRIPENIIEHSLPPFNNDDGNVSISFDGTNLLDTYHYDEDNHNALIDDVEGVSLERIDPTVSTSDEDNWQSAAEGVGFATPGYQNSNFSTEIIKEIDFSLEKKTFSPDGDGFDDLLQLNYRVTRPGFVLNMRVFDDSGHLIKTVTNNEILGRTGNVLWDGTNDNSQKAGLGIYVIFLEYFDLEGAVGHKKLSCVLAKQLN